MLVQALILRSYKRVGHVTEHRAYLVTLDTLYKALTAELVNMLLLILLLLLIKLASI